MNGDWYYTTVYGNFGDGGKGYTNVITRRTYKLKNYPNLTQTQNNIFFVMILQKNVFYNV